MFYLRTLQSSMKTKLKAESPFISFSVRSHAGNECHVTFLTLKKLLSYIKQWVRYYVLTIFSKEM